MNNRAAAVPTVDILLIDPVAQRALFARRALESSTALKRVAHRESGREALASFQRARFDLIVCRPHLGDIAYRNWVLMIRSGKFGYAATPVVVLCDEFEQQELAPIADDNTLLVLESDIAALRSTLETIKVGEAKPSVLVVEDEFLAASAAGKALEKAFRVELAYNGKTALRMWREKRHRLVLLDLMLPDISGLEILTTMIRENPGQVVIVLTAHDTPEQHQELVLAGAVDFLSKPVDTHLLPEIFANALRARQCMNNVARSRQVALVASEFAARTRVAHYLIERGQTARGSAHLRRALFSTRGYQPDEDQWASLLAEFDLP